MSSDGSVYRFYQNNSPLPSDNINDIENDGVSGEVFFATDKGMVSFLELLPKPNDSLMMFCISKSSATKFHRDFKNQWINR